MRNGKIDLHLSDFPMPSTTDIELQVIADLVTAPEEMQDARGIIKPEMFSDEQCLHAWNTLCALEDSHQAIDLATIFEKEDKGFITNRILPKLNTSGYLATRTHLALLANLSIKKRSYQFAIRMLQAATDNAASLDDLLSLPEDFASAVRADLGADSDSVPLTDAINALADTIEKEQAERAKGRPARVPCAPRQGRRGERDPPCRGPDAPGQHRLRANQKGARLLKRHPIFSAVNDRSGTPDTAGGEFCRSVCGSER